MVSNDNCYISDPFHHSFLDALPVDRRRFLHRTRVVTLHTTLSPPSSCDQVTISPPYTSGDVRGKEGQALNHVKKIVDKFYKDEEKRESGGGASEAGEGPSSGED